MDQVEINLEDGGIDLNPGSPQMKETSTASTSINLDETAASDNIGMGLNLEKFGFEKSSHPIASLFHVLFKGLALFIYLFSGLMFDNITIFILVVLCTAFDFWTVKNVSGRLLVGLRWWTTIDAEGREKWIFESNDHKSHNTLFDTYVFWWSQFGITAFWTLILLLKILTIGVFWGTLSLICTFLSGLNLYGYFKCSRDHQKKLKDVVSDASKKFFYQTVMSKVGL